ncbi:Borrelia lipoprotein-containing protein (plasmid) [Borrelia crocidurae str. Achema]|uniref:Variable large protein n=1 Tax=Borrelia crocidurae (strain Achema) TaxID=1155096 RepID=I0FF12_BORCA|nr:Borrelia lipoprotein-containing protein [Borrelia crocidurae str. Achema]
MQKKDDDRAQEAEAAAANAVGKTLSTLIIAIKNTVDSGLKNVNEVLATVTQGDKSLGVTNTGETTFSGQ